VISCAARPDEWFGCPIRDILDDDMLRWEWAVVAAQEYLGIRKPSKKKPAED
jgi:hypothetical protein